MKYDVGQVIFLLNNNDLKIFPVQIEEEIVRRRSEGESIQYKVVLPTKSRDVVDLSELNVSTFNSCADLRTHMIENAIKTIDSLIERANKVSRVFDTRDQASLVQEDDDVVES